jgi:hypothetical protein
LFLDQPQSASSIEQSDRLQTRRRCGKIWIGSMMSRAAIGAAGHDHRHDFLLVRLLGLSFAGNTALIKDRDAITAMTSFMCCDVDHATF